MKELDCAGLDPDTLKGITEAMIDASNAHSVQVEVSRDMRSLWVNVNGLCLLRLTNIENLTMDARHVITRSAPKLTRVTLPSQGQVKKMERRKR